MKKLVEITILSENDNEENLIDDIIATLDTISDQIGWGNTNVHDSADGKEKNSIQYTFKVKTT